MSILEFFERLFNWDFIFGWSFENSVIMYVIAICCIITAVCSILFLHQQKQLLSKLDKSVNDIVDQINTHNQDNSDEEIETYFEDVQE